jgi:hypothetical protein
MFILSKSYQLIKWVVLLLLDVIVSILMLRLFTNDNIINAFVFIPK